MEEILVCVSSPPEINMEIYLTWIDGKSVDECKNYLLQNNKNLDLLSFDPNHPLRLRQKPSPVGNEQFELLKQDIADQFRSFMILEHFLSNPILMNSQSLCIISSELQPVLVDKYWSLDDVFVR